MAQLSDKHINDLLSKCQYKYKDLAKRDIQSALSYFKEMSLIPEKYNYPDGSVKDLISLKGTIPVNYKDSRYNIPVQLYLAETHPYLAPVCYVRPTPDMSINVSETVNSNGRINLSLLNEWKPPNSDLYLLLSLMTMKFSEETPLFSKVSRPSPYQPQNTSLPYPADIRPSYPTQSNQIPYPINNMTPYPMVNNQQTQYQTNQQTPYPVSNNPYYPMPNSLTQTSQHAQPSLSFMRSGSGNNIGQVRQQGQYPPQYADETIKPEHFRMSLISAIQDKARLKFYDVESLLQVEIDSLKRVNRDLTEGEQKINNLINDADAEAFNLVNLASELSRKTIQLNESINRIQHRDKAQIEDAVVTPAPLYRQLMQLFAEELAIQDLVYYLSEGLQRKTIGLDIFLKQVRFLSRRQFMLRATMQKAREKAALPL